VHIYWIAIILMIGAASIFSNMQSIDETTSEQATVDALSRSLLIYRSATAEFARANPNFTGSPTELSLNLPGWYTKQSGITSYVLGGISYTYISGTVPSGLVSALAERTESAIVGVKRSGQLVSPRAGNMAIAIPAPIPEGAVVAVY